MASQRIEQLKENLKIRNKLLSIGIGCPIVGPTGPRGEIGPTGPTARCNKSSIYIFKW